MVSAGIWGGRDGESGVNTHKVSVPQDRTKVLELDGGDMRQFKRNDINQLNTQKVTVVKCCKKGKYTKKRIKIQYLQTVGIAGWWQNAHLPSTSATQH